MDKDSEISMLNSVCKKAKAEGKLTGRRLSKLLGIFGKRFQKALETLKEDRVKKYVFQPSGKVIWIVVGKERDYLIMPEAEFCSCDDFYFRVMDKEVHLCYHLLAQKMANVLGWFENLKERDELYDSLMKEWNKPSA